MPVVPSIPLFSAARNHFHAWRDSGVLHRMVEALRRMARTCAGRLPKATAGVIASQGMKTTESGGERGFEAGKGVKGGKDHIVVDTEGSPQAMQVHPADVQVRYGGVKLLVNPPFEVPMAEKVFADGAYRGKRMKELLRERGISNLTEIVEKPKDTKGFTVLYRRRVVERTFAWMGRCRWLSKDCERTGGELPGVGEAGRQPLPDAAHRKGGNRMKAKRKVHSAAFGTGCQTVSHRTLPKCLI